MFQVQGPNGQPRKSRRKVRHLLGLSQWIILGVVIQTAEQVGSRSEAESQELAESTWKGKREIKSREVSWKAGIQERKDPGYQGAGSRHEYTFYSIRALHVRSEYPPHLLLAASEAVFVPLAIVWWCIRGDLGVEGYSEKEQQKLARSLFKTSPDASPHWVPAHSPLSGTSRVRGKQERENQLECQAIWLKADWNQLLVFLSQVRRLSRV